MNTGQVSGGNAGGDGHWMEKLHKGHLHRLLGVPEGQPIPANKMADALAGRHGEEGRRMAQAAKNMEHASGHTSHFPSNAPKLGASRMFTRHPAPVAQPGPDLDEGNQPQVPIRARAMFGRRGR